MDKGAGLEGKLQAIGSPVEMLRNSPIGPYVFPVRSEFSNWREEQAAWKRSAALLDQSFHMTDLYLKGPDAIRLVSELGVNSFEGFGRDRAKQFVACNEDGMVIGDVVLFGLEDDEVSLVGRPPVCNWAQFHAETGDYDVEVTRDERSLQNDSERLTFRFQVQGPNGDKVIEKATGAPYPDIPFFHMGELTVGGVTVRALNHSMSRVPGLELFGPAEHRDAVRAALIEAGEELGLRPGGSRAYSTVAIESGWIPSPTPAIYAGEAMRAYREWLPADGWEANASIGGSFVAPEIGSYYQTPWDLGYGGLVKFDHDFVGREALERIATEPHRRKVWLSWDDEDVLSIFGSMLDPGEEPPAKYMDLPAAHYATLPLDSILKDGELVGISTYPVYTVNAGHWFSLCMVDEAEAVEGAELTVVWGEPDGGTAKPVVEPHRQTEVRATLGLRSPAA